MAMVELLCEGENRFAASSIDAPHADGSPNYTVDVLEHLRRDQPEAALFALIGADGLRDLPHWRDAARLFDLATWVAVSRPDFPFPEPLPTLLAQKRDQGRLQLLGGIALPVSSTTVRRRLSGAAGLVEDDVSASVLEYIRARHLYGQDPSSVES